MNLSFEQLSPLPSRFCLISFDGSTAGHELLSGIVCFHVSNF